MSEVVSEPQIQLTDSARRKARNAERRRNARAARKAREDAEIQERIANGEPLFQCTRCEKWKDQTKFAVYKHAGKVYRHSKCGACRSGRYLRSKCCKEKKAFVRDLRSKPCCVCGQSYHHAAMAIACTQGRPAFDLNLAWRGHSLAAMRKEAERYSTYCSNCLMVIRYNRREGLKPSTSKLADLPPELAAAVEYSPDVKSINDLQVQS